jgi:hypothetical protein
VIQRSNPGFSRWLGMPRIHRKVNGLYSNNGV